MEFAMQLRANINHVLFVDLDNINFKNQRKEIRRILFNGIQHNNPLWLLFLSLFRIRKEEKKIKAS